MWTTTEVITTVVKVSLVITTLMSTVITRLPDDDNQQRLSRPNPYYFAYGVASHPERVRYGHREESNGDSIKGAYSIVLPDGRTQMVQYEADPIRGYTAKVTYNATPGYTRPPTSTQDSLTSGTTQYNQLPIVQMERSANKQQAPQSRTPHPQVQQAQSSQKVVKHITLPNNIRQKVVKIPSTTTLQPRHVTVHDIRRKVVKVPTPTTLQPMHVTVHDIRRKVVKVPSTTKLQTKHATVHLGVVTQPPHHGQNTSTTVTHSMFSMPWHNLLRLPVSETRGSADQHNLTNSTNDDSYRIL